MATSGSQSRSPLGSVEGGEDLAAACVEHGEAAAGGRLRARSAHSRARRACRRRSTGRPVLAARPRAVAMPIRMPTNEPGPSPTAMPPTASQPPAAAAAALDLGQQRRRVTRAAVRRQAEQLLVHDLAAARRTDGGVGGRRVEADDRHCRSRPGQAVTVKMKTPTRLPSTNQVTRCLPGMFEVILFT